MEERVDTLGEGPSTAPSVKGTTLGTHSRPLLTEVALTADVTRAGLTVRGIQRLRTIRMSGPTRRVESRRVNVSGRVPSIKMGETRQSEAETTEGLGITEYESNPRVLEFYDQVGTFSLECLDRRGHRGRWPTTPDFCVVEETGVYLDEWKTEAELLNLETTWPARYQRDGAGWRSEPAEQMASRYGFTFRIRTPSSVPDEVRLNGKFLLDYRRDSERVPDAIARRLRDAVRAESGLSIGEALGRVGGAQHAGDVYRMIVRGEIWSDLRSCRLSETFRAPLFISEAEAASRLATEAPIEFVAGSTVWYDRRTCRVTTVTGTVVHLELPGGGMLPVPRCELEDLARRGQLAEPVGDADDSPIMAASEKTLRIADERFAMIRAFRETGIAAVPVSTLRSWITKLRRAEAANKSGYLGLVPMTRGRKPGFQLPADAEKVLQHEIEAFYLTDEAPNALALLGRVEKACELAGVDSPSYGTVLRRIADRDRTEVDRARAGYKRAYKSKDEYWYLASDTPRHGERPWDRAHIDHTLLDVVLVDSESGLPLGRPWVTLLIDAHTRRVLAYWLSFDPPSWRSLMMVVRRCVARWERLPDEIVADGGKEFGSVYFERLCAAHAVAIKRRPGEPRFGSVLERFFGVLNTRLVHLLAGNTKITKNVREITAANDPARLAVWTLVKLGELLDEFLFSTYEQLAHPVLGTSPREFYDQRLALTGDRPVRAIPYDETFRMFSLPTTPKGVAMVDGRNRGVKINGRHYRAPELKLPGVRGTHVPVRYDPMDIRHAYAYANGTWIVCYSQSVKHLAATSMREVSLMAQEAPQRARNARARARDDRRSMTDLVDRLRATEASERQAMHDREQRTAGGAPAGVAAEPPRGPATPYADEGESAGAQVGLKTFEEYA